MIDEQDNSFEEVRKILHGLQQVNAPNYFETDLMRKINNRKFGEEGSEKKFSKIFLPKRFIPSAALAIAAVLILFVLKPGQSEIENPFNTEPRIRKDLETNLQVPMKKSINEPQQQPAGKSYKKGSSTGLMEPKSKINSTKDASENKLERFSSEEIKPQDFEVVSSPDIFNYYGIDKSGLNFRQVNLSKTERIELNRLKQNLMRFLDEKKGK